MTAAPPSALPAPAAPGTLADGLSRHALGLVAILFGAFISTLTGRLSTFGLADVRGAIGAGFDEGSWITTAFSAGQMLVAPLAAWAARALGVRRILLAGCLLFALAELVLPLAPDVPTFLALQVLAGLGSGVFIPLVITYIVGNLPPALWSLGIAIYALNLEMSLNISASIEGWYVDHLSWRWIFWQNVPLALAMAACVWKGIVRQAVNWAAIATADLFGIATLSLSLTLLYVALDQGNRLDWLGSGLIVGLLVGGALFLAAFLVQESLCPRPFIDLRLLSWGYLPVLLVVVSEVRFASLGTAYLVPQYLTFIRGFRAPETGDVILWLLMPQLLAVPAAAWLLRVIDQRLVTGAGLLLIGLACWLTATELTADWSGEQFLPSLLLQGLGQTLAISGVIFIGALHLQPRDGATFGAMIQVARLFGGQIGAGFITTYVRKSEQAASFLLGLNIPAGAVEAQERVAQYAGRVLAQSDGPGAAAARGFGQLAGAVRSQANLISYIDGFQAIAVSTAAVLLVLALMPAHPPHPAVAAGRRS